MNKITRLDVYLLILIFIGLLPVFIFKVMNLTQFLSLSMLGIIFEFATEKLWIYSDRLKKSIFTLKDIDVNYLFGFAWGSIISLSILLSELLIKHVLINHIISLTISIVIVGNILETIYYRINLWEYNTKIKVLNVKKIFLIPWTVRIGYFINGILVSNLLSIISENYITNNFTKINIFFLFLILSFIFLFYSITKKTFSINLKWLFIAALMGTFYSSLIEGFSLGKHWSYTDEVATFWFFSGYVPKMNLFFIYPVAYLIYLILYDRIVMQRIEYITDYNYKKLFYFILLQFLTFPIIFYAPDKLSYFILNILSLIGIFIYFLFCKNKRLIILTCFFIFFIFILSFITMYLGVYIFKIWVGFPENSIINTKSFLSNLLLPTTMEDFLYNLTVPSFVLILGTKIYKKA